MEINRFKQIMEIEEIVQVIIVSVPDYRGGRHLWTCFNQPGELEEFEYVEYDQPIEKVIEDLNQTFSEHHEPFHEEAYDVEYTLEELILDALKQEYELKYETFPY